MRDLKFRAWDGTRWIYFSNLSIGLGKEWSAKKADLKDRTPYVYFKDDTFDGTVRLTKHKITQYTGMKDVNGVEIYEGDIICINKPQQLIRQIVYKKGGYRVVKSRGSNARRDNYLFPDMIYASETVKIGDIYTTPEYLNTRPTDPMQLAKRIVDIATGAIKDRQDS